MQVKNIDAERRAVEIRLRAERKFGELPEALNRATPSDAGIASRAARSNAPNGETPSSDYADALARTGTSRQSISRATRCRCARTCFAESPRQQPAARPTADPDGAG